MAEKKYYVMGKGSKMSVFTGKSPRQAALKAAARDNKDIRLRERGRRNKDKTYTVHIFKGSRSRVSAPANKPAWLPDKVWKANVKKVGIERTKKI